MITFLIVCGEKTEKETQTVPSLENNPSKIASSFVKLNPRNDDSGFLKNLISAVQKENFSIAGVLRSCSLVSISDSEVKRPSAVIYSASKRMRCKRTG